MRRDLIGIANRVLAMCLDDMWRPTSTDIRRKFGLKEHQVKTVVRHAKRIAALQQGLMWGWDYGARGPGNTGFFRFCPINSPTIARRMLEGHTEHWAIEGEGTDYLLIGAKSMGYLDDAALRAGRRQVREAQAQILKINTMARIEEPISA